MRFKIDYLSERFVSFIRLTTKEIDIYALDVTSGKRLDIERIVSVSLDRKT